MDCLMIHVIVETLLLVPFRLHAKTLTVFYHFQLENTHDPIADMIK